MKLNGEARNIFAFFSTKLALEDATSDERREVRIKQNEDIYRKLIVAATVFIFVQLFFIISDIATGFYGRIAYSYLNLSAELLILSTSVGIIIMLIRNKDKKRDNSVRRIQLVYYLMLETGFLLYLLSDMLRGLENIYNVFYNIIILAMFAGYSFRKVVILTSYMSAGTLIFLIAIPGAFDWDRIQMLPLFLLLFFLCANFFRAGNTKRFCTQVKLEKLANEMQELSTRDFLTKLPNRTALNNFINNELSVAAKQEKAVGIMMLDIDDFKAFNDFHSHLEGDMCLHRLGRAFLRLQNDKFRIFRYGGEEFLIAGIGISETELTDFAASLLKTVHFLKISRGDNVNKEGYVTVSVGCSIAYLTTEANSYSDLLRSADRALYTAKRRGKNCYVYQNAKYSL